MSPEMTRFFAPLEMTITDAMKQLEATQERVLFAVDPDGHLFGSLTDGDIRRGLLKGGDLESSVADVCNRLPRWVEQQYDLTAVKELMLARNISCIPVLDGDRRIVDLLFWESVFHEGRQPTRPEAIDVPVVIMAGGKGTRLDPFTRVLPKPLIPVGDKTVIEVIIDTFLRHSVTQFFISVNNKARIIKSYFEELAPPYSVEYIEENEPLGTAGALAALAGRIRGPFIVTNCDVIVKADYAQLLEQHRVDRNVVTLVTSMKSFHIPYGVCELGETGSLARIAEKPRFDFLVSTGLYVLEASALDLVPKGRMFHITQLIETVKERSGRVGIYPVGEDSWLDTGEWQEYRRTLQTFNQ